MSKFHVGTGFRLTLEHLHRIASRIEGKDITDTLNAYTTVSTQSNTAGFALIPDAILLRENARGFPPDPAIKIFLFKFSEPELWPDCDGTISEELVDGLSRAVDWLMINGLPEVSQMKLVNACYVERDRGRKW